MEGGSISRCGCKEPSRTESRDGSRKTGGPFRGSPRIPLDSIESVKDGPLTTP